ncbi:triosephosphate isomerase [Ktedonobacteria bacterium brp13]|nr:triosephosphate isomerase [Ktedonobacteria bacterium brp13]
MAMERTAIIAGNWKMNLGPKEASSFALEILPSLGQITAKDPHIMSILCPPAISLPAIKEVLDSLPVRHVELGAQNMYFEEKGAFTGEIAPGMVKELCNFVILGHSERRTIFGETNELVNKKVLAAFKHALVPIVCVGENREQYENGETQNLIKDQIRQSLANLTTEQAAQVVIAYEPIWAIGSGQASDAHAAGNVIHYIRHQYHEMYGQKAADAVRILYGGSVNAENIAEFIAHPDIDGALVGGVSIKHDFIELLRNASKFNA